MRPRVLTCIALAMLAAFMLCGCNVGTDVETLLRPPRPAGEQRKIQQALEEYINSAKPKNAPNVQGGYVLKYPSAGEYRSAFVIKDLDGDGTDEAIVFYRRGIETDKISLNFLKKDKGDWKSVCDIEGAGTNIERVQFGDLDGNGVLEILTGWNLDNVRDRQLVMYLVKGNEISEWHTELYNEFAVDKLTDSSRDSLMIIHSNAADNITTAKLLSVGRDAVTGKTSLVELGSTRLDGYIQRFTALQTVKLNDTIRGVYADGVKGNEDMVTELIYWDGKQLCAPFYDKEKNSNTATYRNALLPSMDLDGDGAVEWPKIKNITNYDQSSTDKIWLTEWESFDIDTQVREQKFSCIINMTDKYYILTDNSWEGKFTLSYKPQTHTLKLLSLVSGPPYKSFLTLRAVYGAEDNDGSLSGQDIDPGMIELEKADNVKFYASVSVEEPFSLSMERLRYIFSFLR